MELETIKMHLYVSHHFDDKLIELYAHSADKAIANYLHKDYDPTNNAHNQAKLLLIGTWYANRESVITGTMVNELPQGISFLLDSDMSIAI